MSKKENSPAPALPVQRGAHPEGTNSSPEIDPTLTLPFSGEGTDKASNEIKQGVSSSPCEEGGWEGGYPSNERIFNHSIKTPLHRTPRKNPTEPERQLWHRIRNKQLSGIKFRRQQGIDRYIVDFYCAEYSLVIEIDGDSHFSDAGIVYDRARDEFLQSIGLTVLRFTNVDVMQNIEAVLERILAQIEKLRHRLKRKKHSTLILPLQQGTRPEGTNSSPEIDPTLTLPFSGEGINKASNEIKQGVSSSPCEGGGWEGVCFSVLDQHKKLEEIDPTLPLPFSGEGIDKASNEIKQGVSSSPCEGGGWEGVKAASLTWDDEGQPISTAFGDVYFSKANGLEETRHVFLHHNQLTDRFAALENTQHFTIAETGFGSGLNFLAAWDLWIKTAPESAQLHFITVEKFPFHKRDLDRALSLWPELKQLADQLVNEYPEFVGTGFHRLKFMNGRVNLTLIIDDAAIGFTKLLASTHPLFKRNGIKVDAWFLDGFAPSKNPQMWSNELFECISCLSKTGTTAATFSAAAIVKNGLLSAGFSIQKVSGFGRKREMVKAVYTAEPEGLNSEDYTCRGSFSPYPVPWTIDQYKTTFEKKSALIIGGGLAGCHSARALAERGWQVKILERHAALAQEGSGNPQGALYAKLSPLDESQAAFNLASLQYALHFYRPLWQKIGEKSGVLQLAYKEAEQELHEQLKDKFSNATRLVEFVSAEAASNIANTRLEQGGLFFPDAGWIDPRKLCAYLVDHPNIHIKYGFHATHVECNEMLWKVFGKDDRDEQNEKTETSSVLIIASAKDALNFSLANHLPIKSIRGQTTFFPETKTTPKLATVVCAEGYIAPAQHGIFCTGATFNLKDTDTVLRDQDHHTNLENLGAHLPDFKKIQFSKLDGRVAFRCSLPDYLPCVGALPDVDKIIANFAPLRKNARAGITTAGTYLPGLYINLGHGARGLAYTPLAAEVLAARINDEPLPIPQELANALNPARFVIRDLIRNKR